MNDLSRLENASSAVRRATENLVKAAQVTLTVILIVLTLTQQHSINSQNAFLGTFQRVKFIQR